MTTHIQTSRQGAEYMLSLGMVLFPIHQNSKVPAGEGWQKRRITTGSLISLPGYNFGVNLGETGNFVVDVDNKGGKDGSAAWADLQRQHGDAPKTLSVKTPTDGFHYYFKGNLPNSVSKLAPGIDIKGVGGYVVAPGSEVDKRPYELVNDSPIAEAPQWVLDLASQGRKPAVERVAITKIDEPSEIARAIAYLKDAEPAIEGSGGNDRTYRIVAITRDFGVTQEKCLELLLEHYNPRCSPMWDQGELARIVENAYNYAQNSHGARTVEAASAEAQADFDEVPMPSPEETAAKARALEQRIEEILAAGEYRQDSPPPRTEPVLWIQDTGIAKCGDLVVIQAKPKVGKSAVIGAAMAAIIGKHDQGHDYLGWRGQNPDKLPLLHFDTEQSPEDHHDLVDRVLARAGISKVPAYFRSFCLTAASVKEALAAILYAVGKEFEKHDGLVSIFIDGVGDLCRDVNDSEESSWLVAELYKVAIKYSCPVILVLHENPGSDSGKTRGHLGSQLERKAASNLRLEKNEKGVTQLWSERLRRGHIAKGEGPAFMWSDERKMHISTVSQREQAGLEKADAFDKAKAEFLTFLRAQPELAKPGDTAKATDLNRMAVEKSLVFGFPGHAERFASEATKFLQAGDAEFRIKKMSRGKTSYNLVERLASDLDAIM